MNKLLAGLTAFIMVISLCACTGTAPTNNSQTELTNGSQTEPTSGSQIEPTSENTNTPIPTPEEIVDIYMNNYDLWKYESDFPGGYCSYGFLDLDFDGALELVCSDIKGTALFCTNYFYKVNLDTETVEKITADLGEQSDYSILNENFTKLYRRNSDDTCFYYCIDSLRLNAGNHSSTMGEVAYVNGNIEREAKFYEGLESSYVDGSSRDLFGYFESGEAKETTKEEYDKLISEYEKANTDLNLSFETILGVEFNEMNTEEQRSELLKMYNAFSYSGFSFE